MEAISARLYFFFNWIKCWCLQPYCLCKLADFRFRGLQIDEHINLPCGDSHSQVLGMLLLEVLLTSFTYDSLSVLLYQDSWPWRPLKMPSRMHSLTCYLSRVRGRWKDHLLFFRQVVFSFRVFFSDGIAFSLFYQFYSDYPRIPLLVIPVDTKHFTSFLTLKHNLYPSFCWVSSLLLCFWSVSLVGWLSASWV